MKEQAVYFIIEIIFIISLVLTVGSASRRSVVKPGDLIAENNHTNIIYGNEFVMVYSENSIEECDVFDVVLSTGENDIIIESINLGGTSQLLTYNLYSGTVLGGGDRKEINQIKLNPSVQGESNAKFYINPEIEEIGVNVFEPSLDESNIDAVGLKANDNYHKQNEEIISRPILITRNTANTLRVMNMYNDCNIVITINYTKVNHSN